MIWVGYVNEQRGIETEIILNEYDESNPYFQKMKQYPR